MDQLTLGGIGLFLVLAKMLNKKTSCEQKKENFTSDIVNNDVKIYQTIINKNLHPDTINKLVKQIKNPEIQNQAQEYVQKNKKSEINNWNNYKDQALTSFSDKPLKDYIHNNFVPFGNVKQNMAGTGLKNGNYKHGKDGVNTGYDNKTPYQAKLGKFTGQDSTQPLKSIAHTPGSIFKPHETIDSDVFGTPLVRPDTDRFLNSNSKRHDMKPCESISVGRGLGLSADAPGRPGYHDMTRTEDRSITGAPTTRGTEIKQVIPGKDYTQQRGPSEYSTGLLGDFTGTSESFSQSSGGKSFVSKRCGTFVTTENRNILPGKSYVLGHSEQADHEHRGDTLRGHENNDSHYGAETTGNVTLRSNLTDKHNIHSTKKSYELPVNHGHANIEMKSNNNAFVNQTQRGEENNRYQLGSSTGSNFQGSTRYTDDMKKTSRQNMSQQDTQNSNTFGGSKTVQRYEDPARSTQRGSAISRQVRGNTHVSAQTSMAAYHNSEKGEKILTEGRPNPGRGNAVADPDKRVGTYQLARDANDSSRDVLGHKPQYTAKRGIAQTRVKLNENNPREMFPVKSGPYGDIPMDSRNNCKQDFL